MFKGFGLEGNKNPSDVFLLVKATYAPKDCGYLTITVMNIDHYFFTF